MAISSDGTGAHTHEISNLKPIAIDSSKNSANQKTSSIIHSNSFDQDGYLKIFGTADVGMDGQKMWNNVHANITVFERQDHSNNVG